MVHRDCALILGTSMYGAITDAANKQRLPNATAHMRTQSIRSVPVPGPFISQVLLSQRMCRTSPSDSPVPVTTQSLVSEPHASAGPDQPAAVRVADRHCGAAAPEENVADTVDYEIAGADHIRAGGGIAEPVRGRDGPLGTRSAQLKPSPTTSTMTGSATSYLRTSASELRCGSWGPTRRFNLLSA